MSESIAHNPVDYEKISDEALDSLDDIKKNRLNADEITLVIFNK